MQPVEALVAWRTCDLVFTGFSIRTYTTLPSADEELRHDFSFFVAEGRPGERMETPDMVIRIFPTSRRIGEWKPQWSTARSTIFRSSPGERKVGFFGVSWIHYRFEAGACEIYCDDPQIAYEVCYTTILSYAGERFDGKGLHRVHGLGIAIGGSGILVMAPSGGGKSTLAFHLLEHDGVELLSEDTPVVGPGPKLIAFPQRIGLRERPPIDARFVRLFRRARYSAKYVISGGYFSHRVATQAPLRHLVLMNAPGNGQSVVKPCSRVRLIWPLFKWLVAGYETPQIAELFLRGTPRDLLAKAAIAWRRASLALALIRSVRAYRLFPSRNPAECAQTLRRYFEANARRLERASDQVCLPVAVFESR